MGYYDDQPLLNLQGTWADIQADIKRKPNPGAGIAAAEMKIKQEFKKSLSDFEQLMARAELVGEVEVIGLEPEVEPPWVKNHSAPPKSLNEQAKPILENISGETEPNKEVHRVYYIRSHYKGPLSKLYSEAIASLGLARQQELMSAEMLVEEPRKRWWRR